jgi:hypothetical protein
MEGTGFIPMKEVMPAHHCPLKLVIGQAKKTAPLLEVHPAQAERQSAWFTHHYKDQPVFFQATRERKEVRDFSDLSI